MVCIFIRGARENNGTCYLEFYTILILRYQLWQLSGSRNVNTSLSVLCYPTDCSKRTSNESGNTRGRIRKAFETAN